MDQSSPGWNTITVGDKSFDLYVSDRYGSEKTLSWFEADSMAKDVGGYLAEIKSAEETELIIGTTIFIHLTIA